MVNSTINVSCEIWITSFPIFVKLCKEVIAILSIQHISSVIQVVMSCVEGSPAARAGIHEGDELVEINGMLDCS